MAYPVPWGVRPEVKLITREILIAADKAGYKVKTVYGATSYPDHNNLRCVDYMIKDAGGVYAGDFIAQYAIKHAARFRVNWIIWNHSIWRRSTGVWDRYRGTSNPHTDHVHLEVAAGNYRAPSGSIGGSIGSGSVPTTDTVFQKEPKGGFKVAGGSYSLSKVSEHTLTAANSIGNIYVMGSKIKANIREQITDAKMSASVDQVTQLTIDLIDPKFRVLHSGVFKPGNAVRYQDLNFVVASVDTKEVAGNEAISIQCRPRTVQALKNRRGAKVMRNASPTDFIISECKAVGAKYHVQKSAPRMQVARDLPTKGQSYEENNRPSSWTTFQRFANEIGYWCFEVAGIIHFGKPSFFLKSGKNRPMRVTWNTGNVSTLAENVPECHKSTDAKEGSTVTVVLPPERAAQARIGRVLTLSGVPSFNGNYIIDSVDFSLAGKTNRLTVSASTPIDPEPTGYQVTKKVNPYDEKLSQSLYEAGSTAEWPVPKKYTVGTKFGVRGNWAAGFHTGADFPAPTGTPVYAVFGGKVIDDDWGPAYGKHIVIQVGTKRYGYCHLSAKNVAVGKTVTAGQTIGRVGSTGRTTGPHLHLELRYSPYKYNNRCADPIPTIRATPVSSGGGSSGGNRLLPLLQRAGFSGTGLKIAAGVVWAESNGNAKAFGDGHLMDAVWGYSVGLFQIRSVKNPGQYSGIDGKRIHARLTDPLYNAKLAYEISRGGRSWGAWSTYNNGSYRKRYGQDGTIKNYT